MIQFPNQKSEAERLEDAADAAFREGDYRHAHELWERARYARRRARERAAGIADLWTGMRD